jgi:signal peptidase I
MRRPIKFVLVVALCGVIFAALVFLPRTFQSLQVLRVQGRDMEPTLHEGDLLLGTRRFDQLRRGDIVSFRYPPDPSNTFIKRIVGLPGEIIEMKDGKVLVNGQELEENYLNPQLNRLRYNSIPAKIPEGEYYVMGDNRDNSNDSRFWGPLPKGLIQTKIIFHY